MLRDLVIVVEALIEVDLAVAVEIVKACDLIAAAHEDLFAAIFVGHDLQAQWLKETGRDALPGDFVERLPKPVEQPDVAVPSADGRALAILEEVESTEAHPGFPRVGE